MELHTILELCRAGKSEEACKLLKQYAHTFGHGELKKIFNVAIFYEEYDDHVMNFLLQCDKFLDTQKSFELILELLIRSSRYHPLPPSVILHKHFDPTRTSTRYSSRLNKVFTWFMELANHNCTDCIELCIAMNMPLTTPQWSEAEHIQNAIDVALHMSIHYTTSSNQLLVEFKNDPQGTRDRLRKKCLPATHRACDVFVFTLLISENLFRVK